MVKFSKENLSHITARSSKDKTRKKSSKKYPMREVVKEVANVESGAKTSSSYLLLETCSEDTIDQTTQINMDALIQSLIKRYINAVKTSEVNQRTELITSNLIVDLEPVSDENETFVRCKLECCICSKKIRVIYRKYWYISNFVSHLKAHKQNFVASENESVEPPPVYTGIAAPRNEEQLTKVIENSMNDLLAGV